MADGCRDIRSGRICLQGTQTVRDDLHLFFLRDTQTVRDAFGLIPDVVGRSNMYCIIPYAINANIRPK